MSNPEKVEKKAAAVETVSVADQIEEFVGRSKVAPVAFQSMEALKNAEASANAGSQEDLTPLQGRLIDNNAVTEANPEEQKHLNQMVMVRPRETVKRFRYGGTEYQLIANKRVLIPRHVALVLEQKGAI